MYLLASSRARLSAVLTVVHVAGCSQAAVFSMTPTGRSLGVLACGKVDGWSQLALPPCLDPGLGLRVVSLVLTIVHGAACSHAAVFAMTLTGRSSGILGCGRLDSWEYFTVPHTL